MYSVLFSTDFTYSCVPGDQGDLFFFIQEIFLDVVYVQIGVLQIVSCVQIYGNWM